MIMTAALLGMASCLAGHPMHLNPARAAADTRSPEPAEIPIELRATGVQEWITNRQDAVSESRIKALAHFGTGIVLEARELAGPALEEYRQAALADPAHEDLVLEVARRLLLARQPEPALELLAAATGRADATAAEWAMLALARAELGQPEKAIEADRTAIRLNPRFIEPYQHLSRLQVQAGDAREALKVLETARQLPDADVGFLTSLAESLAGLRGVLGKDGDHLRATILEVLERARKLNTRLPSLQLKLADLYRTMGEFPPATRIYNELLARHPELPGLRAKLAEAYLRTGENRLALEQLEKVARQDVTNPQLYYLIGNLASDLGDYKKAIEHYQKCILLNAEFQPVYYDLTRVNLAAEKPEDALEVLGRIRAKFPRSFLGEFMTGLAQVQLKKFPDAIQSFNSAEIIASISETNRLTHAFYFQLGAAYERNKNMEQAEKHFRRCLALDPEDAEAMNYLAYMWAEQSANLEEAQRFIDKAVAKEPKNGAFLDTQAWILFRSHKLEEALRVQLKAVELTPKPDATLWDHLGDIYQALKQAEKAREAWQKSLSIEPNDEVKKKL